MLNAKKLTTEETLQTITLKAPYLLFVGSETEPIYAKTAAGLAHWVPEKCMGQLSLPGGTIDLGLPKHDVVSAAIKLAQPGDTVLLAPACASMDQFDSYVQRGQLFSQAVKAQV